MLLDIGDKADLGDGQMGPRKRRALLLSREVRFPLGAYKRVTPGTSAPAFCLIFLESTPRVRHWVIKDGRFCLNPGEQKRTRWTGRFAGFRVRGIQALS